MSRTAVVRSSGAAKDAGGDGVAQRAGTDRVALGVVGVEQAVRRRPLDHLGQLPSEIHRVLHAGVEALATVGGMDVGGVAGQQHAPSSVGRGLPGGVGETGYPGRTVNPVVGAVDRDEGLAHVAQGGFGRGADVRFGHHDRHRAFIGVDHLAVADLVLHPAERVLPEGVAVETQLRLLGYLHLGDQAARRRVGATELNTGTLADQAAPAIAPNEVHAPAVSLPSESSTSTPVSSCANPVTSCAR